MWGYWRPGTDSSPARQSARRPRVVRGGASGVGPVLPRRNGVTVSAGRVCFGLEAGRCLETELPLPTIELERLTELPDGRPVEWEAVGTGAEPLAWVELIALICGWRRDLTASIGLSAALGMPPARKALCGRPPSWVRARRGPWSTPGHPPRDRRRRRRRPPRGSRRGVPRSHLRRGDSSPTP